MNLLQAECLRARANDVKVAEIADLGYRFFMPPYKVSVPQTVGFSEKRAGFL